MMTSNLSYGQETTGTEVGRRFADEIKGRIVVITGVSPKSLGEYLAITIAHHEPDHLILASRTKSKLLEVQHQISSTSKARITIVPLDLSSQSTIRKAAGEILGLVNHIDVLINNAGVVTSERQETTEGLELQFGTNHVGHFLLTSLLLPRLLTAEAPRVVNVTSLGYQLSPVRFHDYNFEGKSVPLEELPPKGLPRRFTPNAAEGRPYFVFCAYGQSKTANILHAVSLNEKFGSKRLRALAVHPGSIWTDLPRFLSPEDHKIIEGTSGFWKTHDQGIATTLVAAFDPQLARHKERVLLSDCQLVDVLQYAKSPELAERLWKLSECLVTGHAKL